MLFAAGASMTGCAEKNTTIVHEHNSPPSVIVTHTPAPSQRIYISYPPPPRPTPSPTVVVSASSSKVRASSALPRDRLILGVDTHRPSVHYETPQHIPGSFPSVVTDEHIHYERETAILLGEEFQVERNIYRQPEEMEFFLRPEQGANLVLSPLNKPKGRAILSSEVIYIPSLVMEGGKKKTEIPLRRDGLYGLTADLENYLTDQVHTGVIIKTAKEIGLRIATERMNDVEYYTPMIEPCKISTIPAPTIRPFYLSSVGETYVGINLDNGQVTLMNESGFYMPKALRWEDYLERGRVPVLPQGVGQAEDP